MNFFQRRQGLLIKARNKVHYCNGCRPLSDVKLFLRINRVLNRFFQDEDIWWLDGTEPPP
jgi:hypothetical protein